METENHQTDVFRTLLALLIENYLPHIFTFFENVDSLIPEDHTPDAAHTVIAKLFNFYSRKNPEYKLMIKTLVEISQINLVPIIEYTCKLLKDLIKKGCLLCSSISKSNCWDIILISS